MNGRGIRSKYKKGNASIKAATETYENETGGRVLASARRRPGAGARGRPILIVLIALWSIPIGAVEITGDHRLIDRFVEDAAVVQRAWYGLSARYSAPADGRDLQATFLAAFRLGHDVEVGVQAGFIDRRRDAGERLYGARLPSTLDATGIDDVTLFAKYRVLRGPFELALGGSAVVPLADEEKGLGAGNFQARGFAAVRKEFRPATFVFSCGISDRSAARGPVEASGRSALALGAGVLVPLSYDWTFLGEITSDGARYRGDGSDSRALAGLDWRPTPNLVFRGAMSRGLSDAAPSYTATLSAAFRY